MPVDPTPPVDPVAPRPIDETRLHPGPAAGPGPTRPLDPASPGPTPHFRPAPPGYDVVGVLGRGGMGVVYRATQVRLKREVALKVVLGGEHAGPTAAARFRTEAEAVAALHHPNVIQVFDSGEWDGQPYLAMEFAAGGSLRDKLAAGPLPVPAAVGLVATLARAVEAAHAVGIIHRDLKPANILFTADGTPKVADFGLAKRAGDAGLTVTGAVMGSPGYMAPEQAAGRTKDVGPRTDVYALGAILYECLTGRPPFAGESLAEVLDAVRFGTLTRPRRVRREVPASVEAVCLRCLARHPADRYPSAAALADALSPGRSAPRPDGRRSVRRVFAAAVLGALACLTVAGLVWRPVEAGDTPPAAAEPRGPAAEGPTAGPAARREEADAGRVPGGLDPAAEALRPAPTARPRRTLALLVGVGWYPRLKPRQPRNRGSSDVEVVARRVAPLLAADDLRVLTQRRQPDPTADNVRRALADLAARAGPDDSLLVVFSGRGMTGVGTAGFGYWPLDVEGDLGRPEAVGNVVSEDEVAARLAGSKAGVKLFLVDGGPSPRSAAVWGTVPGGAALFGCGPTEECIENDAVHPLDGCAGLFTYAALTGLSRDADADGDGLVTWAELNRTIDRSMKADLEEHNVLLRRIGRSRTEHQNPTVVGRLPDAAPVLSVGRPPP